MHLQMSSIMPSIAATPAAPAMGYISDIFGRWNLILAGVILCQRT